MLLTTLTRSLSRDNNEKKVLADSFRVPTVYRIGSLHLSEGVGSYRSDMSTMFDNAFGMLYNINGCLSLKKLFCILNSNSHNRCHVHSDLNLMNEIFCRCMEQTRHLWRGSEAPHPTLATTLPQLTQTFRQTRNLRVELSLGTTLVTMKVGSHISYNFISMQTIDVHLSLMIIIGISRTCSQWTPV